ncbi:hypothetical protein MPH_01024 [Macrophomina phaseolina MS6]|uniref:Uncharacterized protein n=1 Tax=Macrophomina phaseolina (strain MS6) TaxID=1126212 RepID=K2RGJ0_MACPH|nr:hypothetical protein MPH_01024 [Macrophomina phaseolina MS6]
MAFPLPKLPAWSLLIMPLTCLPKRMVWALCQVGAAALNGTESLVEDSVNGRQSGASHDLMGALHRVYGMRSGVEPLIRSISTHDFTMLAFFIDHLRSLLRLHRQVEASRLHQRNICIPFISLNDVHKTSVLSRLQSQNAGSY